MSKNIKQHARQSQKPEIDVSNHYETLYLSTDTEEKSDTENSGSDNRKMTKPSSRSTESINNMTKKSHRINKKR